MWLYRTGEVQMQRNSQPVKRQRGRELSTVLLAFAFTLVVARPLIVALGRPPFVIQLVLFVLFYAVFYFLFWRLTDRIWNRDSHDQYRDQ
ncbi:MAG: hypothetical protein NVSMB52_21170 [Chloroflexota bacterium]